MRRLGESEGGLGGNDGTNKGNPPVWELAPRGTESHHWIGGGPLVSMRAPFCNTCFAQDIF